MALDTVADIVPVGLPKVNILLTLELVMFGVAVIMAFKYFLPMLKAQVIIEYFEMRGGKVFKLQRDYAQVINEDGNEKWKLFRNKMNIEPQSGNYLFPVSKKKDKIYMVKDAAGFFHPIELAAGEQGPVFNVVEKDVLFFFQQERKRKAEKYLLTGWKQHLPIIAMGSVTVLCLIVIIMTTKYSGTAVAQSSSALAAVGEGVKELASAVANLGPGTVNP